MTALIVSRVFEIDDGRAGARFNHGRDLELIAQLERQLSVSIPLIEGSLASAPDEGFVLWSSLGGPLASGLGELPLARARALAPRLIDTDASGSRILRNLELSGLAGALDSRRNGVYGNREVARKIGATCDLSDAQTSERYCLIRPDAKFPTIAAVLSAYLVELAREPGG